MCRLQAARKAEPRWERSWSCIGRGWSQHNARRSGKQLVPHVESDPLEAIERLQETRTRIEGEEERISRAQLSPRFSAAKIFWREAKSIFGKAFRIGSWVLAAPSPRIYPRYSH